MRILRWVYPSVVGLLLGLLQTGLYFQLSFTLSSSIRTFLLVTVCWLMGSVVGIHLARQTRLPLNGFILLAFVAYFACILLLGAAPFNTRLWPVYAAFIMLTGNLPRRILRACRRSIGRAPYSCERITAWLNYRKSEKDQINYRTWNFQSPNY